MSYSYPTDHQTLLLAFIQERRKNIHESSSELRFECRKLEQWAHKYASQHALEAFTDAAEYGIYYDDDEQDSEIAARLKSDP